MPNGLYIGATSVSAGKTTLCMGIGLCLQTEGVNLGYMKPVSMRSEEKHGLSCTADVQFLLNLFGITEPLELVEPVVISQDMKMSALNGTLDDQMPTIKAAYKTLAHGKDLMLLGGMDICYAGKFYGLDCIRLIQELDLKAVFVDRMREELNYDRLLMLKELLGDHMLGVVLNDVPPSFQNEVEHGIKPYFKRKGLPVLGVIPSDSVMRSIRASELAEQLGGRLIAAQNHATRMVEDFIIGTMQVENFMSYFRRQPNAAVLVGGDRADIQLVAIEGECPCIILTGNLFPNDIILSRADSLKVPIVMVREDTHTVAKKLELILNRHRLRDVMKVRQGSQLVRNYVDLDAIRKGLGLNSIQ